ncbi:MAG: hypothetical protein ACRDFS_02015 [Chloroflexota bacterium]
MARLPRSCLVCGGAYGDGVGNGQFFVSDPFWIGPLCSPRCAESLRGYDPASLLTRVLGSGELARLCAALRDRAEHEDARYRYAWGEPMMLWPHRFEAEDGPIPGLAIDAHARQRLQLEELR